MVKDIKGLGNDIIGMDRFRKSVKKHGQNLLNRLFTAEEQKYCNQFRDPVPHFAARFAAKEAIAKAIGTGIGSKLLWHDIEILKDPLGKPIVHFSKEAKKRFQNPFVLVSMSHCISVATATAIWH